MTEAVKYPGQLVFGLDIGTRSIVGTVGYKTDDTFHVVAQVVKEHDTRAMMDGQIHDINKVGATINGVKVQLEQQIGRKLTDVCIAAAGRVLRTISIHADYELPEEEAINQEHIYCLDMLGLEKAHEEFHEKNDTDMQFYCVGYTVEKYYLNHYPIKYLENHKGKSISADLIATFLPNEVVDGLHRAVAIANLEVANLTLEPIAAIQVAIPEMYRMLNIALVDVGAGTSDICITKDGSIAAYGMIPSAGDEITEVIAKHFLVDFAQAEKIKVDASGKKRVIAYKDIIELQQKTSPKEVTDLITPVIKTMTGEIAAKIKELNGGKAVSAVFIVGGGGKITGFTNNLAKALGISAERVALRGEEVLREIDFQTARSNRDSMFVTPIGICLNFYNQSNNFIFVGFNGQRIKLYNNNRLSVVDAAMQIGLANDALFAKRGEALNFTINGKIRMVRGELGEAAVITLNGNIVSLNAPIEANDKIVIKESSTGAPGALDINQLPEYDSSLQVIVNEQKVILPKFPEVNEQLQSGYYAIQEGDDIKMLNYYTVKQVAEFMDVIINTGMNIYVNNKLADLESKVYENFSVIWTMEQLQLSDVEIEEPEDEYSEEDEYVYESSKKLKEQKEEKVIVPIAMTVTVNEETVTLNGKEEYIFVDVFDYIDFDLSTLQGKSVKVLLNNLETQFTEGLKDGDILQIFWEQ